MIVVLDQQAERADARSAGHRPHHVPDAHRREHSHPAEGEIRRQDATNAERVRAIPALRIKVTFKCFFGLCLYFVVVNNGQQQKNICLSNNLICSGWFTDCVVLVPQQQCTNVPFPHVRDLQVFEELFSFACPKFLSPVVPNYDNVHPNYHKEPFQQQLKVFAEEVQQQAQLSTIRR